MAKKINRRGRGGSQRVVVSLFRPSALSAVFRIAQKIIKSLCLGLIRRWSPDGIFERDFGKIRLFY